ncbi:MAG: hypothetical protein FDZ75_00465 [Actinobacteria bacterium]|nr:MAG: hypothetical protein FDZ75_00465 [Actinomycetota bacterium]
MAGDRRTLWGLIDGLRDYVAAAGMFGWPIVFVLAAPFICMLATVLRDPLSVASAFAVPCLLIVIGFPLWARKRMLATKPFAGFEPIPIGQSALLESALQGAMLATGVGSRPDIYDLPSDTVNAGVWLGRHPVHAIAVTRGMQSLFSHDELEAVFAHLLVRTRMPRDTITFRSDDLQRAADAEAARLLGYPIALCSALEKTLQADTAVPCAYGSLEVSFFVGPMQDSSIVAHADTRGRLMELRESSISTLAAPNKRIEQNATR